MVDFDFVICGDEFLDVNRVGDKGVIEVSRVESVFFGCCFGGFVLYYWVCFCLCEF